MIILMRLPKLGEQESVPRRKGPGRPPVLSVQERKDRELALKESKHALNAKHAYLKEKQTEQHEELLREIRRLNTTLELIAAILTAGQVARVSKDVR